MLELIIANLEKVGIGAGIFLLAYLANIGLGAWKNVTIDGQKFDWKLIAKSAVKYVVLGAGIACLSVTVSILPAYATYIGIKIAPETLQTIDGTVIVGSFMTATIRYVKDAVSKIKNLIQ